MQGKVPKSVAFLLSKGEDLTMFFSMGVLQIVIEALAILLTLLLITFSSAFFYFCCYKLQNVRAARKDKVLSLAKQGWEYETDKPTIFFMENE